MTCKRSFLNFPESVISRLNHTIEIEKGIFQLENFCFSVTSKSKSFGMLSFDVDDTEIIVFRILTTFTLQRIILLMKKTERQILLTCEQAIRYIKDL